MLNFICNPKSGHSKASECAQLLKQSLEAMDIPHEFHFTTSKQNTIDITREITSKGAENVIVIGGDGTLHDVLNGISDTSAVTLGLIPCGSGNDFASSAGIPLDPYKALGIILNGKTRFVDYMECSGVRGINVMGTGVDVDILKRCYNSKVLKGKFKYAIATLVSVFCYKYPHLTAIADGVKAERETFILSVANGKCFGCSIVIAPHADISDGKLDYVLVNSMKWYHKPNALIHLAAGKILDIKQSEFTNVEHVEALFDKPTDIEIDGEIYHDLKFDVRVVHDRLKMFTK